MKTKIAITGLPGSKKTFLAQALSAMTEIPYIRTGTMYEWRRLCNAGDSSILKWKDMFLIASAAYFERATVEAHYEQFISDGAVFSEWVWLKSYFEKRHKINKQHTRIKMIENMEYVCATQAANRYDFIVHVGSGNNRPENDVYKRLYAKYKLMHSEYNTETIEVALGKIANDLQLPIKHSAETSMHRAKTNLFLTVSIWKPKINVS